MATALIQRNGQLLPSGPLGSVDAYVQAVSTIPVLSQDEEHTLAVRFREEGDLEAAR